MTSCRHVSRDTIIINLTLFCREFILRQSHQKSWLNLIRKRRYVDLCALGVKNTPYCNIKVKLRLWWAL